MAPVKDEAEFVAADVPRPSLEDEIKSTLDKIEYPLLKSALGSDFELEEEEPEPKKDPSEFEPKGKVLLTGGTGFIASHILDCLLEHQFDVVVTVRSEKKGMRVMQSLGEKMASRHVTIAIVEDVAKSGAFNEVLQAHHFDYVVHTASPYQLGWKDPVKECLDPAIKGTMGLLKSVHAFAPSVKRVVMTSSSAAILRHDRQPEVYDESFWSDVTWNDAMNDPERAYVASKKFSEEAAWKFMENICPSFSFATINNTYTFGPLAKSHDTLEYVNTSNKRIYDLIRGEMRGGFEPTKPVFTFVDVRDVALAHVRAMTVPEAAGKRFYVIGGFFTNHRISGIIRRQFGMKFYDSLPPLADELGQDDFPTVFWGYDNSRSIEVLRLDYADLEKSVTDTVNSIVALDEELRKQSWCPML